MLCPPQMLGDNSSNPNESYVRTGQVLQTDRPPVEPKIICDVPPQTPPS